jgi:alanine dehydrogenase
MPPSKPSISMPFAYEPMEGTLDMRPRPSSLLVGIPREQAFQESRVAITPDAAGVLVSNGHGVVVEHRAGEGAQFSDQDYSEAGARIVFDRKEVFQCGLIAKSAPVSDTELDLLQQGQTVISPIHLPVMRRHILERLMDKRISALSFENLKDESGHNPIVRSMSEIAGSAVMLIAGQYLGDARQGRGMLLGGISGIPPAKVVIIGAGIVGEYAARTALALGASVKIFDNDIYRLKRLQNNMGARLWTSVIEPRILARQLKSCDVAVGALSSSSGRTPIVVTEEMVSRMRPGSVVIDVSIDRGGCFETSEMTTHENPVVIRHGVQHYCVPNIPSRFARTASQAVSNVLMPLLLSIADEGGLDNLIRHRFNLRSGVYVFRGAVTNAHLSERFDLKYTDLNLLLASSSQ